MNTPIKILLIVLCLVGAYVFLTSLSPNKGADIFSKLGPIFNTKNILTPRPTNPALTPSPSATVTASASATPTSSVVNLAGIVYYDGKTFSPNGMNVKLGQSVEFKNISSDMMWVASEPYPTNDALPELNSQKVIEPGQSYVYTTTKAGTWGFHDQIQPGIKGNIVVQ